MVSSFSLQHRLARAAWKVTWLVLCRWTPRPLHVWRALVLSLWGARVGARCHVYPGAIIWAPWQLTLGDDACVADGAEIYNVAPITLGARSVVSQGAYLCAASHDHRQADFPMTCAPIHLGDRAWVAARAIVLPGITIGAGAVAGAGSVVTRDIPDGCVAAGNPARIVRQAGDAP
ncbi:MAG: DapH/DapD/GlmU-related protein [Chthoniobacter sp.]|uniref:DapH/DapD/GlmU-related protein n=1 Tax=Chthoniobacter sp. TaxID=2510640 RepID=UPI0032A6D1C6